MRTPNEINATLPKRSNQKSKKLPEQRTADINVDQPNRIKERRYTVVDATIPKKIQERRKSIIHSLRAIRTKKANLPKRSCIKDQEEIDETREKAREMIRHCLLKRIDYQNLLIPHESQLTEGEILIFAKDMEQEIFDTCNYPKQYMQKHREMVLNITNQKNNILFSKISRKLVTPQEVVHMSINQLASAAVIEERENYERRSNELIVQNVTDQLANPPVYIIKSQRGDKIIKNLNRNIPINLDPMTSARDLLTAFNDSTGANLVEDTYRPALITKRRMSFNPSFQR